MHREQLDLLNTIYELLAHGDIGGSKTYHVSHLEGDDNYPGTEDMPVQTIATGLGLLSDGDALYVRGDGEYDEAGLDLATNRCKIVFGSLEKSARAGITDSAGGIPFTISGDYNLTNGGYFEGFGAGITAVIDVQGDSCVMMSPITYSGDIGLRCGGNGLVCIQPTILAFGTTGLFFNGALLGMIDLPKITATAGTNGILLNSSSYFSVYRAIVQNCTNGINLDAATSACGFHDCNLANVTNKWVDLGTNNYFVSGEEGSLIGTGHTIQEDMKAIYDQVKADETTGPYTYLDAGGEQDVHEDTSTTRRKICINLSNRNMTQAGKFRLYEKVDGTNYDELEEVATTVGAGDQRAWYREVTVNQSLKITYEEDVDEGADRDIPFEIIEQPLEQ